MHIVLDYMHDQNDKRLYLTVLLNIGHPAEQGIEIYCRGSNVIFITRNKGECPQQ